ncbi:MAG: TolC family protein [Bryobacterales bacterium]|jgi:outer membrane protein TolC|nr:TolC family protein [Bryobacterales bacterium]
MKRVLILFLAGLPLLGQQPISLREAVERALRQNPGMQALQQREQAAGYRRQAARSGYLPQVNYQEMVQRGNNPVFVFGTLLTQRQFSERNFAINSLNRPDFVTNFQSMVTVDQVVFNAGRTGDAVKGAEIGKEMEGQRTRTEELALMQRVAACYLGAKLGEQALAAARESARSATADLERAESFRREGMNTDADVLSIRVYLASVKQEVIERQTQLQIAHAALNVAMGEAEEATFQLVTPLLETAYEAQALEDSQQAAVSRRPELGQALRGVDLARLGEKTAKSAYWPEVFVRGVFETDRQEVLNKGGANWFLGGGLRWNVFNGLRTQAQVGESKHQVAAAEAEQRQALAGVRFQVRQAWLQWKSVQERLSVASATVAEAEESLRITRDRYENGLATVTDLLRTEAALLGAKTNYLAALYGQRTAAVHLEAARGTLESASLLFD